MSDEIVRTDSRRLREMLTKYEGIRLKPYKDTRGFMTIGIGRNLDAVGISQAEALLMLSSDIDRVIKQAMNAFPWFNSICVARQDVILAMIFQLGMGGVREFKQMLFAIQCGNFNLAADEMLASDWAKQTPDRTSDMAKIMRSGMYI